MHIAAQRDLDSSSCTMCLEIRSLPEETKVSVGLEFGVEWNGYQ